jgi:hypothetical protein
MKAKDMSGSMILLPPSPDKCQECAVKHEPGQCHDATSMFYGVKFKMDHGRSPTWKDAMAHCSDEVKKHWIKEISAMGIDIDSTNTRGQSNG